MARDQYDYSHLPRLMGFEPEGDNMRFSYEMDGAEGHVRFGPKLPALWPVSYGQGFGIPGRINEPGQIDEIHISAIDRRHQAAVTVRFAAPSRLAGHAIESLRGYSGRSQHVLTIKAVANEAERNSFYDRLRAAANFAGAHVWTYRQDKRAGTLSAELLHAPDFSTDRLLDAVGETLAKYQPVLTQGGFDSQPTAS